MWNKPTCRARLVEGSSTARSCHFPVDKTFEIEPNRWLLRLTYLVQVDKGLLQPSCEQSGSLCDLAFIQKAQQFERLDEGTLWMGESTRIHWLLGLTPPSKSTNVSALTELASRRIY